MKEESKKNEINISVEKFAKHITPLPNEPRETNSDKYVRWGDDNLYPNELIKLKNTSSAHSGILKSKENYVFGDGVIDKKNGDAIGDTVINEDDETLNELVKKIVDDVVMFNGFAVKVDFNVLAEPIAYTHIAFQDVRANKSKQKFFVNEDWYSNYNRTYLTYPKFNTKFNDDAYSKVFYFTLNNISSNNIYPLPSYFSAIEDLHTDAFISQLFKNNVANGFSLTKIISTFNGTTDKDTQRKNTQKFRDVFTGVDGDGFLLNQGNPNDKAPEVLTIPQDDYASKLIEVIKKTEKNILSAHGGTSAELFALASDGATLNDSGGGLETAYQLFKNNYIKNTRGQIVGALNKLFQLDERLPILDIKDSEIDFSGTIQLSDAIKEKSLTVNEARAILKLKPLKEGGERMLADILIPTQPLQTYLVQQSATSNQFAKDDEPTSYHATMEDYEKVKHLGTSKDQFTVLSESKFSSCGNYHFASSYNSIEEYLLDNQIKGLTLDEATAKISDELGYTVTKQAVKDAMDLLRNANLIQSQTNTQNGKIDTNPSPIANPKSVEVWYDYVLRDGVSGPQLLDTSRHFCTAISNSGKYFSAKDIATFSATMGYDCMKYCGGWFKNTATGETTPYCRHEWKPIRVIKN